MTRLRATIVIEYDADPFDYETDVPSEMVAIDQDNIDECGIVNFMSWLPEDSVTVKVEAVE